MRAVMRGLRLLLVAAATAPAASQALPIFELGDGAAARNERTDVRLERDLEWEWSELSLFAPGLQRANTHPLVSRLLDATGSGAAVLDALSATDPPQPEGARVDRPF